MEQRDQHEIYTKSQQQQSSAYQDTGKSAYQDKGKLLLILT